MKFLLLLSVLLMLGLGAGPCHAQTPGPPPGASIDICKRAYDALQRENALLKSKGSEAALAYTEYYWGDYARRWQNIRLDAYSWQARASEVLLWVVVAVCLSGIIFSGFQLWRATAPRALDAATSTLPAAGNSPNPATGDPASTGDSGVANSPARKTADPLGTSVSLSLTDLRVTSSVIGLVVLIISIAYLYLFLTQVYGIRVVHDAPACEQAAADKPAPKSDNSE